MYVLVRPNSDNIKFPLDLFSDWSELGDILKTYVNRNKIMSLQKSQIEKIHLKILGNLLYYSEKITLV